MKNSTLLEKIKALLSNEVKLEQMLMGDGVTKIEKELGWKANTKIVEGLRKTLEWYNA